jgi:CRISPR-associated protein Csy1
MLDPAIENFFSERKEAWLKKNLKASMTEVEKREKELECENVFSLPEWLPNAAKRAGQISISTHPCTFSHPSARKNKNGYVTSIIAESKRDADGFLRAGNVDSEPDALGNAAALDVYKFLTLIMSDGNTLLSHLQQESELSDALLKSSGGDEAELRAGFLKMVATDQDVVTSSKIKQVYFPVEGDYHQLSILTNSANLYELRKRIDFIRFSDEAKDRRELKKSNKFSEHGFSEIFGLTTIGYGGTKPQNISVLNNQNAGKAHMLMSAPPSLTPRNIKLPKEDFFVEVLNPWHIKETFDAFHRIVKSERKTFNLREGRDYRIQEYVDYVLQKMWQLRNFIEEYEGELSSSLKAHQKIWLYPDRQEQRENEDEWLDKVCRDLIRSFISQGYKKVLGSKEVLLGDNAYAAVERIVEKNKEALR